MRSGEEASRGRFQALGESERGKESHPGHKRNLKREFGRRRRSVCVPSRRGELTTTGIAGGSGQRSPTEKQNYERRSGTLTVYVDLSRRERNVAGVEEKDGDREQKKKGRFGLRGIRNTEGGTQGRRIIVRGEKNIGGSVKSEKLLLTCTGENMDQKEKRGSKTQVSNKVRGEFRLVWLHKGERSR